MLATTDCQCPDPLGLQNDDRPTLSFFICDTEYIYKEKLPPICYLVAQQFIYINKKNA